MHRSPRQLVFYTRRFSALPPVPPTSQPNAAVSPSKPPAGASEVREPTAGTSKQPPGDIESPKALPVAFREWSGPAAAVFRGYADQFTLSAKTTFSQLGSQLNKVTGYEEIEALKRRVVEQESRIEETRRAAKEAKVAYEQAVAQRSKSQKEVNDLLQRKSTWSDGDVGRFTTLVRQDHLYEQEEQRAQVAVDETEASVEREFSELMRTILARYHEEQVWSDKIRSASTYGSLAALGLNLFVFITAILVVEPWKRKRLAQTFEKKVEELSQETAAMVDQRVGRVEALLQVQADLLLSSSTARAPNAPAIEPSEEGPRRDPLDSEAKPPLPIPPSGLTTISALLNSPDVQTVLAAGALVAGSAGWLLRAWVDR
ncbi:Sensitive to high expression protein 9, mitochondrial [Pleurotus pulmonarius]